jgi:hypothetical protein
MATITLIKYPWTFVEGVRPGQNYYGYIIWGSAPVLILQGTSTITATPLERGNSITVLDTTISGIGPGTTSLLFTIRNSSSFDILYRWNIFLSIIRP